jgi:hypothetical protein
MEPDMTPAGFASAFSEIARLESLAGDARQLHALPRIPFLRLRFTLHAQRPACLPRYQGSLLRGAFGHALRTAVCAFGPAQPCESCRLRRACTYTRLFETFIEDAPPPFLRGLPTSPRPYLFEPRESTRDLAAGEPLEFRPPAARPSGRPSTLCCAGRR